MGDTYKVQLTIADGSRLPGDYEIEHRPTEGETLSVRDVRTNRVFDGKVTHIEGDGDAITISVVEVSP